MSEKYKMSQPDRPYFVTLTIVDWIDVFTRKEYKWMILDSLKYCQNNKGLILFGYCIMTNHLHLIAKSDEGYNLSEILRDFKKYTLKKLIELLLEVQESRREWMLERFAAKAATIKRNKYYKVWQDGNHAKVIIHSKFFWQKLEYIHNNPVEEMIVEEPEDYLFSSARNYAGKEGLLEVILETPRLITYS